MDLLFFLHQGTALLLIITGVSLTVTMAAEMLWPRRALISSIASRWLNNFSLALITWYVTHLFSLIAVLAITRLAETEGWGLFQQFDAGVVIPLATLLLVSQFFSYFTHVIFHHVPILWPLHAVHHTDVDVDISTSYRHHPLETLIFLPILIPIIVALGISPEIMFAHQAMHIFLTIFSHGNVRLPRAADRYLSKLIVTPDFHRVHHSSEQQYTNSNYGGVVPWFDYLFGTAKKRGFDEHESFELGLEYHRDAAANRLDKLLLQPFIPPADDASND